MANWSRKRKGQLVLQDKGLEAIVYNQALWLPNYSPNFHGLKYRYEIIDPSKGDFYNEGKNRRNKIVETGKTKSLKEAKNKAEKFISSYESQKWRYNPTKAITRRNDIKNKPKENPMPQTKHRKNFFLFFGTEVLIWNPKTKKACLEPFAGNEKIWHLTDNNNITQLQAKNFKCGELGFKSKQDAIDYKMTYRTPKSNGGFDVERNPKHNRSLELRVAECPRLRKQLRANINSMKRLQKKMEKAILTGNHPESAAQTRKDLKQLRDSINKAERAMKAKANPRHKKNMYGPFILEGRELTFGDIRIGQNFFYDGQLFKKKSSRTAHVFGRPKQSYYFKKDDVVESDMKSSRKKASGVFRKQIPNPKTVNFYSTTKGNFKEKVSKEQDIYTVDTKWKGRVGYSDIHYFPAYMKAKHAKPDQVYYKTRYQAQKAADAANAHEDDYGQEWFPPQDRNPRKQIPNPKFQRQSDGSYLKSGKLQSYYIVKERVRSRGKSKLMWALYTRRGSGEWSLVAHYSNLAEAKKSAGASGYLRNPRKYDDYVECKFTAQQKEILRENLPQDYILSYDATRFSLYTLRLFRQIMIERINDIRQFQRIGSYFGRKPPSQRELREAESLLTKIQKCLSKFSPLENNPRIRNP